MQTSVPRYWPTASPTARAADIKPPGAAITTGAPVVADLDGDGRLEVVVTDADGNVWAWEPDGTPRAGFAPTTIGGRRQSPVHIDAAFSNDDPATGKNNLNRTKRGIAAAPSVGDLDGDGRLEIVVAALDRHVYAWHADGRAAAGFPVLLVDPAKVATVDPTTNYVTFTPTAGAHDGGELITTPTLGDVNGDGRPEIVVGAQEEYAEPVNIGSGSDLVGLFGAAGDLGNGRLYAISPDGTNATYPNTSAAHPDEQAYLPGWPVRLGMLQLEALPTIGDGVSASAAIGDVNSAPGREVIASSAVGPMYVLNAHGDSVFGTGRRQ